MMKPIIALAALLAVPAFAADNTVSLRLKDHTFTPAQVHVKAGKFSSQIYPCLRKDSFTNQL